MLVRCKLKMARSLQECVDFVSERTGSSLPGFGTTRAAAVLKTAGQLKVRSLVVFQLLPAFTTLAHVEVTLGSVLVWAGRASDHLQRAA